MTLAEQQRMEALGIEPVVNGAVGRGDYAVPLSSLAVPEPAPPAHPLMVTVGQCTKRHVVKFHWCVCAVGFAAVSGKCRQCPALR